MRIAIACFKYGVDISDPCCYPLGFMYIASMLKTAGHDVKILNYNLNDYDFCHEIKDVDAVFMTGFEEFLPDIEKYSAVCRDGGIKVILGGALATFKPLEMLKYVDTVIIGEGETVIKEALTRKGVIYGNEPGKPCIDEFPLPDYEGFGIDDYHRRHSIRYMGVLASRGCPHKCKFCAQTCHYQERNISQVMEEIDIYKRNYQVDTIIFNDNTLNVSKKRFLDICDGIRKKGVGWSAAIRCDNFDNETARAAKNSGAQYFVVGVESFKQKKLNGMRKGIKSEQIIRTLDLLHKHKIAYHGNILTGLPGETFNDIVDEIEGIPAGYNVFPVLVQPFIGTEYQERSITKEQELILSEAFRGYVASKNMHHYPTVTA